MWSYVKSLSGNASSLNLNYRYLCILVEIWLSFVLRVVLKSFFLLFYYLLLPPVVNKDSLKPQHLAWTGTVAPLILACLFDLFTMYSVILTVLIDLFYWLNDRFIGVLIYRDWLVYWLSVIIFCCFTSYELNICKLSYISVYCLSITVVAMGTVSKARFYSLSVLFSSLFIRVCTYRMVR